MGVVMSFSVADEGLVVSFSWPVSIEAEFVVAVGGIISTVVDSSVEESVSIVWFGNASTVDWVVVGLSSSSEVVIPYIVVESNICSDVISKVFSGLLNGTVFMVKLGMVTR
jgi:hypothetical protein